MGIFKRGTVYWFSFVFAGQRIQKSTKQRSRKAAIDIESAFRTALAKNDVGILERRTAPTLKSFLEKSFIPFAETKHAAKPATLRYYKSGCKSLVESSLAQLKLDEITDENAQQFAARHSHLSPATVNCFLRTLRRAIYLAAEWGTLDRRPKICLASGEHPRERVLTDVEIEQYLSACEPPWKDIATVLIGTAARPGEVLALRWENVLFGADKALIQIVGGKSRSARRVLPLLPIVRDALEARWQTGGKPSNGWVFESADSRSGHLETIKDYHARALRMANEKAKEKRLAVLKSFPPYTFRHTALTRMGEAGVDPFTLAKIAGHSSITITSRYCHPGAESIDRAFSRYSFHYTPQNALPSALEQTSVTTSIRKG